MANKQNPTLILLEPEKRLNHHFSTLRAYLNKQGIPFKQVFGFTDPMIEEIYQKNPQLNKQTFLIVINNSYKELCIPRNFYFGAPSVKIFCYPYENKLKSKIKILKTAQDLKNAYFGQQNIKKVELRCIKRMYESQKNKYEEFCIFQPQKAQLYPHNYKSVMTYLKKHLRTIINFTELNHNKEKKMTLLILPFEQLETANNAINNNKVQYAVIGFNEDGLSKNPKVAIYTKDPIEIFRYLREKQYPNIKRFEEDIPVICLLSYAKSPEARNQENSPFTTALHNLLLNSKQVKTDKILDSEFQSVIQQQNVHNFFPPCLQSLKKALSDHQCKIYNKQISTKRTLEDEKSDDELTIENRIEKRQVDNRVMQFQNDETKKCCKKQMTNPKEAKESVTTIFPLKNNESGNIFKSWLKQAIEKPIQLQRQYHYNKTQKPISPIPNDPSYKTLQKQQQKQISIKAENFIQQQPLYLYKYANFVQNEPLRILDKKLPINSLKFDKQAILYERSIIIKQDAQQNFNINPQNKQQKYESQRYVENKHSSIPVIKLQGKINYRHNKQQHHPGFSGNYSSADGIKNYQQPSINRVWEGQQQDKQSFQIESFHQIVNGQPLTPTIYLQKQYYMLKKQIAVQKPGQYRITYFNKAKELIPEGLKQGDYIVLHPKGGNYGMDIHNRLCTYLMLGDCDHRLPSGVVRVKNKQQLYSIL